MKKRFDKGDVEAMVSMALCCLDGAEGLPKDEAKGIQLLKRAADMGSARAMYHLGYDYIEGDCGVTKDEKKGMRYLKDGVKKGDVSSRRMLASFMLAKESSNLLLNIYVSQQRLGTGLQ